MTRRELFKKLVLTPIAGVIGVKTLPYRPISPFFSGDGMDLGRSELYGIPYHQSNASTGEWLGFKRA
jgi:hypothetical protein